MSFLAFYCILIATLALLVGFNLHEKRIKALEEIYNRPLGNCLEVSDLLRNRHYPPKHGVHSYAKPVPICPEP